MNARASVEVDGALLEEARRAAGLRTDEEVVEALPLLVRTHGQTEMLGLAGKVRWEGDLGSSRRGRHPPEQP